MQGKAADAVTPLVRPGEVWPQGKARPRDVKCARQFTRLYLSGSSTPPGHPPSPSCPHALTHPPMVPPCSSHPPTHPPTHHSSLVLPPPPPPSHPPTTHLWSSCLRPPLLLLLLRVVPKGCGAGDAVPVQVRGGHQPQSALALDLEVEAAIRERVAFENLDLGEHRLHCDAASPVTAGLG